MSGFHHCSEPTRNENFKTDEKENRAAEDIGFARDTGADLFADMNTDKAYPKGDGRDERRRKDRHGKRMLCDGKANGKRINGGRNSLNDQTAKTCFVFGHITAVSRFDAFDQHLTADKAEKTERDPRNPCFKGFKILYDGMDTYPTDEGHERLKESEKSGDTAHFALFHFRLVQTVGKRDRKRIHGKSDAEHDACKKEIKIDWHFFVFLQF